MLIPRSYCLCKQAIQQYLRGKIDVIQKSIYVFYLEVVEPDYTDSFDKAAFDADSIQQDLSHSNARRI